MTRIVWGAVGERFFETGVDRGVLYVDTLDGIPWNGLVTVTESPTGGDVTPFYIDGIKYLNVASAEEFEATIEAFTYPDEFAQCDGTLPVKNGLFAAQQPKKSFGLTYRTRVGNDVDADLGYKIHVVYNAMAAPTQRTNSSISDSTTPENFSWKLVTKPPNFTGYKPTAHFVVDSRVTSPALLAQLEDILYGSASSAPRLPAADELISMFQTAPDTIIDAGLLVEVETTTVDGGAP